MSHETKHKVQEIVAELGFRYLDMDVLTRGQREVLLKLCSDKPDMKLVLVTHNSMEIFSAVCVCNSLDPTITTSVEVPVSTIVVYVRDEFFFIHKNAPNARIRRFIEGINVEDPCIVCMEEIEVSGSCYVCDCRLCQNCTKKITTNACPQCRTPWGSTFEGDQLMKIFMVSQ